jgi:hypothetical protein
MARPRHTRTRQTDEVTGSVTIERLTEIAEILALGLQRLRAAKSSALSAHVGESPLHFSAGESGHAVELATEISA